MTGAQFLKIEVLSKEFNRAKKEYDDALSEITSLGNSRVTDAAKYDRPQSVMYESNARMKALLAQYSLIEFFSGIEETETVTKEIDRLEKEINEGLDDVKEKLRAGKYPVWKLDALVNELLRQDKYKGNEQSIRDAIKEWESAEFKKDLFITIGTAAISVAAILVPGGCMFGLLLTKALLTGTGAVLSIKQGIDDYSDASMNKSIAYASVQLSDSQRKLVKQSSVSDATKQQILSGAFALLGIFDALDTVKSVRLIAKLDKLDDATKAFLKGSEKWGAKLFQNLDETQLNKLGKLSKEKFYFIAELPNEEMVLFGKKFEQLSDVAVDSVKDLPVDLLIEIKKLEPNDINVVATLADGKPNLMEAVFKERQAIVSGKNLDELVEYFNIPYTPKDKSLTMYQTRIWYKWRETKIPGLMKNGDSLEILEANARKAFEERNFIRQKARDCMLNRAWAEQLQLKEVNKTWEQILTDRKEIYDNNMKAVYQSIINSSQKSRPGVDHMYGL